MSDPVQNRLQECLFRLQSLRRAFHQAGDEDLLARAWRIEAALYEVGLKGPEEESLARLGEISRAIDELATCR